MTATAALSFQPSGSRGAGRFFGAAAASLVLHGAILAALLLNAARPPPRLRPNEITLEVHTIERPKPPPLPPPKVIPAEKIEHVVVKHVEKLPPKLPPPPNQPPPPHPAKAPPPIRIGVNLESTVPGGDFAAPVGNSMYGQAPEKAAPPAEAKPYWAAKFVPPSQLAELPVELEKKVADYPLQARKDGIEGDVVLMVTIDAHGKVVRVRIVSGPGHGLDEAAAQALKQFRWKPATYQGEPVATEIRYTYSWEID